ncbi:MAG: N-acetyltransferase [Pirellulales bacterium]|nr:N-acetyltransferase [Pirellulales bacterium]
MTVRIHPTAIIEADVELGPGTAIWDNVHIRRGAKLGAECIVGGKSYIAYDVRIGDRCKINSFVYICHAVTLECGVMISAGTIFTNDRFPRATTCDLQHLRPSEPDEQTLPTLVREGATIGAGCVIGNDLTIGRFAMVGMGSVVTRSLPDFHLAIGNPARSVGCVCRCGEPLLRFADGDTDREDEIACPACGLEFAIRARQVREKSNEVEARVASSTPRQRTARDDRQFAVSPPTQQANR